MALLVLAGGCYPLLIIAGGFDMARKQMVTEIEQDVRRTSLYLDQQALDPADRRRAERVVDPAVLVVRPPGGADLSRCAARGAAAALHCDDCLRLLLVPRRSA